MRRSVTLTTHTVRKPNGKRYTYYQIRWFGADGGRYSTDVGRTDQMSKRQAEKLRQAKELELRTRPGLRSPGQTPDLDEFLDTYLASRKSELAQGTWDLHEQTARYLKGFFGDSRRIDRITRYDAREFKTALAAAKLNHVNKRKYESISPYTVDLYVRNARTIFNRAVDDDLILYNPFDRMTGGLKPIEKNWHYVSLEEFYKFLAACPNQGWRTFLGLCRLAGLRQSEALTLPWRDVDWETNRLSVWASKTKRRRIVPIAPELLPILRDAFEHAPEGEALVVRGVVARNVWRDFGVIRKRAGVPKFPRWCHTLRKNRERDWMDAGFPFHVVVEWMGHSDEVARQHYLRVDERDLCAATHSRIGTKVTQLVTQLGVFEPQEPKQPDSQPSVDQGVEEKAGDGIRTHDVQLGKLAFYH